MQSDEERARDALYGPETRSGHVEVVQTPPDVVWAVENVVRPCLFHVVEPWTDWDAITWDWPSAVFTVEEPDDHTVMFRVKKSFAPDGLETGDVLTVRSPTIRYQ